MSNNSEKIIGNYQNKDNDEINFKELISTLYDNKWLILLITLLVLIFGILKAATDAPIYRADSMLQVEESSQPLGSLDAMEGLLESKVPVKAEIEIVKSRMVLSEAVNSLNLDILAYPNYFPFFGQAIAKRFEAQNKDKISAPLFGYSAYAWGGELIQVDTLNVPTSWLHKTITLISGNNGKFKLKLANSELTFEGEVGIHLSKTIVGEERPFELFISLLKVRPGTHFTLVKHSQASAIKKILNNLSISEKGKGTGILSFKMESTSPSLAMQTLNKIANIYVRMNVEQKSAEAQNTLNFLDTQLPAIKNQLEAATSALNEYRLQKGSINLSIETQSVLKGVVENKTQITLLLQKRDDLRRRFTSSHPSVIAIDKQIGRLQSQMKRNNKKITELPETQQVILRLSRDVKVNTELYTTLLNHLQTIKVAKAGTVGDVRIIDYAVLPTVPVKPRKTIIIIVSLLIGLLISTSIALIRKAMRHGVEDPDFLENHLDIPVYATVPHSKIQQKLHKKLKRKKDTDTELSLLVLEDNEDLAIESLRSLRTTLHFAFLEAKNNIIMLTGPSPGIGKTFIATNLAIVLANLGKKVLLIDADMRKGYINKCLGVKRENGLSDLISNKITTAEAIHKIETMEGNIDFITTGNVPPNPSELLLQERFDHLLESLCPLYDQIIIDTPPVLAVTDACIIGRLASATLMVIKAGEHPIRELEQSTKRLKQNDISIKGFIFNDVPHISSKYGYGGNYIYQYSYKK